MPYINLNGKIIAADEAHIPVDNGSFRYGYGLFETMLVEEGVIALAGYHWDRLESGMKQLQLQLPPHHNTGWMMQQVLATVKKNNLEELCRVRLQVYAGGGGLFSADSYKAGMLIECFPMDAEVTSLNKNGLVVGIATGVGKMKDTLSNLKTANGLIYAVAARQAREQKWNDALIVNTDTRIIESTIANIFWVKDGTIYTPPLADGCVAGVMRRRVMELCTVEEKSLVIGALFAADEVFLTNAIRKIKWVGRIGDKRYGNERIKKVCNLV